MDNSIFKEITKKHSTTFYYASLLLPKMIRDDVFVLYAFLRTADDLVDEKKDKKSFIAFKNQVYSALLDENVSNDIIINTFVKLFYKYKFQKDHLDSFFDSLGSDFDQPLRMKDKKALEKYIYGVAGVVGLMMAKIMQLPKSSYKAAQTFGELMQRINILRDIREDFDNNRVYLPQSEIEKYGLKNIDDYKGNEDQFIALIRSQITNIRESMNRQSADIQNIPQPYRRSIKISRDVYKLIYEIIYQDPLIVWEKRVFVNKIDLMFIIIKNIF